MDPGYSSAQGNGDQALKLRIPEWIKGDNLKPDVAISQRHEQRRRGSKQTEDYYGGYLWLTDQLEEQVHEDL